MACRARADAPDRRIRPASADASSRRADPVSVRRTTNPSGRRDLSIGDQASFVILSEAKDLASVVRGKPRCKDIRSFASLRMTGGVLIALVIVRRDTSRTRVQS